MSVKKGYWVIRMNGSEKFIVYVSGKLITECGSEDWWRLDRDDLNIEWVRRIRL